MNRSDDRPAMGSPKLPKLRHGEFSSAPKELDLHTDAAGTILRVDCTAGVGANHPPPVTPSPMGVGWTGGWMPSQSKERSSGLDK